MILNRRLFVGSLTAAVAGILPTLSFAQGKGTIAIITPSHDNPFFKAEADGAAAKATELGYAKEAPPHGPQSAHVGYPYYTTRGPRDFLVDNPPSIGP